jgi:orotidine-5'-phosphate decarboxylase
VSEASPAQPSFGARLATAFSDHGQLCVGIDPHSYLLESWGLADSADGARELGLRVVEAAAGRAAIVKPQIAFYERYGSAGYAALEEVLAAARAAGLLVIADVKRGDVGTSVEAYAQAWLTPGGPLEADAMTISAFQGVGSLARPLQLAVEHGKGLFVLAATSNPEAAAIQRAVLPDGGRTVAAGIVDEVAEFNRVSFAAEAIGSIGLVLGATLDLADYGIDLDDIGVAPATPVLAPGFGHQGARYSQLGELYGAAAPFALVSASRSILSAGPDGIVDTIAAQAKEVAEWRA